MFDTELTNILDELLTLLNLNTQEHNKLRDQMKLRIITDTCLMLSNKPVTPKERASALLNLTQQPETDLYTLLLANPERTIDALLTALSVTVADVFTHAKIQLTDSQKEEMKNKLHVMLQGSAGMKK